MLPHAAGSLCGGGRDKHTVAVPGAGRPRRVGFVAAFMLSKYDCMLH